MSLLPIPPLESATDPIASPADLQQRWRALVQELGFGERLLRITFVGPDRCLLKVLLDVEMPLRPVPAFADGLMRTLADALADRAEGHTVAMLLTRPGRGGASNNDRRWCAVLTSAAARHGIPIEPVFRANDENLVALTPRASAA